MADIEFDSDDGFDLQSGTFHARFGPILFVHDRCNIAHAGAVSGQSSVSGVRSVSKDYASYVSEQLQHASAYRQQQV